MTKTKPTDWIFFAQSDLASAKKLAEEEIYHLACFHCQQAAEKALKARLISLGQAPPKTHVLAELVTRIAPHDPSIEDIRPRTVMLDKYYVPTRYPDALPGSLPEGLPTREHAEEAVKLAEEIVGLIQTHVQRVG